MSSRFWGKQPTHPFTSYRCIEIPYPYSLPLPLIVFLFSLCVFLSHTAAKPIHRDIRSKPVKGPLSHQSAVWRNSTFLKKYSLLQQFFKSMRQVKKKKCSSETHETLELIDSKFCSERCSEGSRASLPSVVMYYIRYDICYIRYNKRGSFSRPFAHCGFRGELRWCSGQIAIVDCIYQ